MSIVKNQGNCGSCWTFSTTGAIESAYAIKYPKVGGLGTQLDVQTFSEQQLVDCAGGEFHNNGCNGGWYGSAYDYLQSHKLETEDDYGAYKAREGTCDYQADKGTIGLASYSIATNYQ